MGVIGTAVGVAPIGPPWWRALGLLALGLVRPALVGLCGFLRWLLCMHLIRQKTGGQTYVQAYIQTDRQANGHTYSQTDRQRQTETDKDGQRHTETDRDRQTQTKTVKGIRGHAYIHRQVETVRYR